ncbi:melatonin receptor type 1B-A-like [Amphiura filiformis]|uniref:melatonin receptor type 1B-A-like n=1 Tax=Amphiura filiformis TaxID=82378 RepID=UPI003B223541
MEDSISEQSAVATTYHPYYKNYIERQILASLIGIIAVLGFCGNCLVILAVALSRKLRNSTNVFVVNLALADLLTCLFLPWTAIAILSEDGWTLPMIICIMDGFCLIMCLGCSINTLACISINRLVLVTKARQNYTWLYTPRKIAIMLFLIWLLPAIVATIPLVSEAGELGYDFYFSTCSWDSQNNGADLYGIIVTVSFYPFQLSTIVICYFYIFYYVRKHFKKVTASTEIPSVSGRHGGCHIANDINNQTAQSACSNVTYVKQKKLLWKRQVDVTKNLFYVVCMFLICFTPYAVCIIIQTSNVIFMYTVVILLSNSCVNFFVYASKHPDFRNVFKCIFLCKFTSIPERASFWH